MFCADMAQQLLLILVEGILDAQLDAQIIPLRQLKHTDLSQKAWPKR